MERRIDTGKVLLEERDGEPAKIRGMAAVYNRHSQDLGGFREVIAPGAFTKVLEDLQGRSDVVALWNHDPIQLLGRTSSGTVKLAETDSGLSYEIDPPDTTLARDLMTMVRRGDVFGSSFAFVVGEETWGEDEDGPVRTVRSVARLADVSLVTNPAYLDSEVAVRSFEAWKASRLESVDVPSVTYTPSLAFIKAAAISRSVYWEAKRRTR